MIALGIYLLFGVLFLAHAALVIRSYNGDQELAPVWKFLTGLFVWLLAWPALVLAVYHKAVVALAKGEMEL